MTASVSLEPLMQAHGGLDRWRRVEAIEGALSSGGFAFTSKMQPNALRDLTVSVQPHARRVVLDGFGRGRGRGVWTPEHVALWDGGGALIGERTAPRTQFSRPLERLRWDTLDILYFAGYALWNYLSFPFLLGLEGVRVTEASAPDAQGTRRLVATFAPQVPTHSAVQTFHVDASWQLLRHDYTADVIGGWAHAANLCLAAQQVAGLRLYTRRQVFPRLGRRTVLPLPTLVWIELDALKVIDAALPPGAPQAGP